MEKNNDLKNFVFELNLQECQLLSFALSDAVSVEKDVFFKQKYIELRKRINEKMREESK